MRRRLSEMPVVATDHALGCKGLWEHPPALRQWKSTSIKCCLKALKVSGLKGMIPIPLLYQTGSSTPVKFHQVLTVFRE